MDTCFRYFAYGSNMSLARLKERTTSAERVGAYRLPKYSLRFHKESIDGSGKCDAYYTGNDADSVYGALFTIHSLEKPQLDRAEGRGSGYKQSLVNLIGTGGDFVEAITYVATTIEQTLKPYSWYKNHVLIGAIESALPEWYIAAHIRAIETIIDKNTKRDANERKIYK